MKDSAVATAEQVDTQRLVTKKRKYMKRKKKQRKEKKKEQKEETLHTRPSIDKSPKVFWPPSFMPFASSSHQSFTPRVHYFVV
jgi:hypothetical protein